MSQTEPMVGQSSSLEKGFEYLRQLTVTLFLHKSAYEFIREHKPWQGLKRLGWIVWAMAIAGALLSYQFFREFYHAVEQVRSSQQPITMSLASAISFEKLAWVMEGSRKYLVMIVMELVVFYFIQKTLEIRIGRKPELTTKAFVDAEIRIFKVTIFAWVLETITRFLVVDLALGIVGFNWLKNPTGFLIQCYFLGFAMIDNYHECFDLDVSGSEKRARHTAVGVAVAIGLVAHLFMYLPVVGAVIATMLGAVTATLAMERFAPIAPEEHLAIIAEQEKKKKNKRHNATPSVPV